MQKTICVVTSTRADYGLLKNIIKEIDVTNNLNLLLFVTGTHLEEKYGYTYKNIEEDGFKIDEKISMNLTDDTPKGILKSMALEMSLFADLFDKYKIDFVVVLGDRYEILVIAQISLIYNIPLIHFCGGDITEGAYDNEIRDAITKIATYHFVTCESSKQRVINMGEPVNNVFLSGNPGLLDIVNFQPMIENELYSYLNINKKEHLILVVFHPETHHTKENNEKYIDIMIDGLLNFNKFDKTNIIFIHSNADNYNSIIFNKINKLVSTYENIYAYISLPREYYLNLIHYCNFYIGNSSSGIYEVPLFKKITLNIGNRQVGREHGDSVILLNYDKENITNNINKYLEYKIINKISYPYIINNDYRDLIKIFKD